MGKLDFSVGAHVSRGWEFAKKYGLTLAAIYLIITIIAGIFSGTSVSSDYWTQLLEAAKNQDAQAIQNLNSQIHTGFNWGGAFSSLIETVLMTGFIGIILQLVKGTMQKVSLSPYAVNVMVYVKYFAVEFICGLLTVIGVALCVIPGIWVSVKLSFAGMYQIDHPDAGIGESIKASWKMTDGNFWSILGMSIVCFFINVLGLICCCIGFFFTQPMTWLIYASAYYDLLDEEPVAEQFESTVVEEPVVVEVPAEDESYNKDENA